MKKLLVWLQLCNMDASLFQAFKLLLVLLIYIHQHHSSLKMAKFSIRNLKSTQHYQIPLIYIKKYFDNIYIDCILIGLNKIFECQYRRMK